MRVLTAAATSSRSARDPAGPIVRARHRRTCPAVGDTGSCLREAWEGELEDGLAEINEVKQDLAGVKAQVGAIVQSVEKQGEKQGHDMEQIKAMFVHMVQAQTRRE